MSRSLQSRAAGAPTPQTADGAEIGSRQPGRRGGWTRQNIRAIQSLLRKLGDLVPVDGRMDEDTALRIEFRFEVAEWRELAAGAVMARLRSELAALDAMPLQSGRQTARRSRPDAEREDAPGVSAEPEPAAEPAEVDRKKQIADAYAQLADSRAAPAPAPADVDSASIAMNAYASDARWLDGIREGVSRLIERPALHDAMSIGVAYQMLSRLGEGWLTTSQVARAELIEPLEQASAALQLAPADRKLVGDVLQRLRGGRESTVTTIRTATTEFTVEHDELADPRPQAELYDRINDLFDESIPVPRRARVKLALVDGHPAVDQEYGDAFVNMAIRSETGKGGALLDEQQSLDIGIHEWGHVLFREAAMQKCKHWRALQDVWEYQGVLQRNIDEAPTVAARAEQRERLAALRWLYKQRERALMSVASPYNELVGDTVEVLFLDDGAASAKSISLTRFAEGADGRDFTKEHTVDSVKLGVQSTYEISAVVKTAIWKARLAQRARGVDQRAALLAAVLDNSLLAIDHILDQPGPCKAKREAETVAEFTATLLPRLQADPRFTGG